jgi:hypothetical protein
MVASTDKPTHNTQQSRKQRRSGWEEGREKRKEPKSRI